MIKRSILTGAALLLSLVVLPATASSAQARPNVTGTGITHCNGAWARGLKFAPPLVTGGVATSETVTLTATVANCAGGTPPPTSGAMVGKGVINGAGANNCANYFFNPPPGTDLFTFAPGAFGGSITWTPAAIAPSSFSLAAISATTTALAAPVTFKAVAITVTGSYPTGAGKFKFNTVKTLATILGGAHNCGGVGLSALKIAAAGSTGKF